ncbi:MAG: potassium transporter Kef [Elusimicrobia bacterium GWC2_51_8]|nr:MAG: potassium transporter Kef [Elusimicrobia bacterium GWA2_51_34]OGR63004.1 MAG: potassium transporter Kef [Elusimicrobia bacterium GWC2_51_8]OGR85647.1 MAG: potassium transporter Kef [Elusimicrobia bacterium GWF2_52_66]HAF96384.1 potassium transporter Kef [Elusimicrobiota bacterium]HCE98570.1 potassium transporter Kef [Elusimicrobiota bacterium]
MEHMYATASLWLGLAVISAVIAYHLKISIALIEICVGVAAGAVANRYFAPGAMDNNAEWLKFLAGSGAIFLTFLAGAELDKKTLSIKWKEILLIGLIGFLAPFLGCSAAAYYLLGWTGAQSLLAGVALSTTSMAVVYAVMVETGFNSTEFGKGILGSCFINDLGTVIVLGLIFAPFTYKTVIFIGVTFFALLLFPYITNHLTNIYGNRTAAIRVKWISFFLFSLGALALWSGSEAVLPAYIAGMALAEFASQNNHWLRRLRTLTVGFLTPFYFLRAGSLVSIPALVSAPLALLVLFSGKVATKIFGLYPAITFFRKEKNERWYYTLMMSTGLTFGTISALYGFSHGIIDGAQYSLLVIAVIASAVIPTMIAGFCFTPKHLLPEKHRVTELKEELVEE